jgi:hypothetical protein
MRLDFTLSVDRHDLGVGIEIGHLGGAEIEHGPARGIVHLPSQRLGQARPGQADLDHGIFEMHRGQPRGAERPVLLLRVLQDQERYIAFDWLDAVADAQRLRLAAMGAVRDHLFGGAGLGFGLF